MIIGIKNTQHTSRYQKVIGYLHMMWSMLKVRDFTVEPVERKVIQNFIHKHHYSHNTNGIQQMECFALFSEGRFGFCPSGCSYTESFTISNITHVPTTNVLIENYTY